MRDSTKQSTKEIQDFRRHLESLGYSQSSVQALPRCVKDFLAFALKETAFIESQDIEAYHGHLEERPNQKRAGGLSEMYIHQHFYALKLFFAWQIETERLIANPISALDFPSPKVNPKEILTLEETKELYLESKDLKEKALLGLFYGCGLRRAEGEKLDLKDLHFRNNMLYVREGKGGRRRAVPMGEKVKNDLKSYALKERRANRNETAFLINKIGKRMSGNSCNKLLKELLLRTQIKKEISLHSLRHSIATHLLELGLSLHYVRDFLGHKHLESTQIYARVNPEQLYNL